MFIGVLCLSLIALLQAQSLAWTFVSAGWGYKCYFADFVVRGGSSDLEHTFLGSQVSVLDAGLVCVNPGNLSRDVRIGMGGITFSKETEASDWSAIGDRYKGIFAVHQTFNSSIVDFGNDLFLQDKEFWKWCNPAIYQSDGEFNLAAFIEKCPQAITNFNEFFFGVDQNYCRNTNWIPYEYLIRKLTIAGAVYYYETATKANMTLSCETDESYRHWNEDGNVTYVCKEVK